MFRRRLRPHPLLTLIAALVLVLSACAQQQPAAPAAAPTSAPAAAAPTTAPAAAPTTAPAAAAPTAAAAAPTAAMAAGAITAPGPGESPIVDNIRKNGKLRAGVAISAPFLMQDPGTKKYFGPTVDLTEQIASLIGVELEYVETGWDVVMAGIQSDKFDLAVSPLFVTPKRMEVADFVAYGTAGTCYFLKKENTKVNKLEDMNNPDVSITTFTGTGTEEGIRKAYPKATIISIVQPPGGQFAYEEVLTGRSDVAPIDSPLAKVVEIKYPQLKLVPPVEECLLKPDIPFPVGMGFRKGDPKFTAFLQSVADANKAKIDADMIKYSDPKYHT
jgi:polar amino acid transport system substrate-binding protein